MMYDPVTNSNEVETIKERVETCGGCPLLKELDKKLTVALRGFEQLWDIVDSLELVAEDGRLFIRKELPTKKESE